LQEWANTLQMQFNVQKCEVVRLGVSNKDSNIGILSEYSIGSKVELL